MLTRILFSLILSAATLEAAEPLCFELTHTDGTLRNICDRNKKKYLIIEFFSPGCGACQRNVEPFKMLERETATVAHSRLVSSGKLIKTQNFINRHMIQTQVALDDGRRVSRANNIRISPTVLVIDDKNQIIFQSSGILNSNVINHIKALVH